MNAPELVMAGAKVKSGLSDHDSASSGRRLNRDFRGSAGRFCAWRASCWSGIDVNSYRFFDRNSWNGKLEVQWEACNKLECGACLHRFE